MSLVQNFTKVVSSSIEIAASPERVWRVLTDFPSYPLWNPFISSLSGSLELGKKLVVRIEPPGGRPMTFRPIVLTVEDQKKMVWMGRLLFPNIFDGEHRLELVPSTVGTSFTQREKFTGFLVALMSEASFTRTQIGFQEMNEALKRRAES